jgi:N-acetylmuramic acid 6-phosphate etherase
MEASDFLSQAKAFDLGHLPTEGFDPRTRSISALSKVDLGHAIETLRDVDSEALGRLRGAWPEIHRLKTEIKTVLDEGNRVYLSGCGATGRLALVLEQLWLKRFPGSDQVRAFMAGGDYALVKSVENFEDFPEFGEKQLLDLGFNSDDLLIAITEGGETPFVIGSANAALKHGKRNCWFCYCNPREVLTRTITRSQEILDNPRIESLELFVGPMALSGSTRLQAATVQMLAIGCALFDLSLDDLEGFIHWHYRLRESSALVRWIEREAAAYEANNAVLYSTRSFPITVLTDTTERSPTFSLTAFETTQEPVPTSWCYLSIPDAKDSKAAWLRILGRAPRGLDWPSLDGRLSEAAMAGFDFSAQARSLRAKRVSPKKQHVLSIERSDRFELMISWDKEKLGELPLPFGHPLFMEVAMKLYLNQASLLIMCRIERVQGNIMTHVRPSNGKLIDRAARYTTFLLEESGVTPPPYDVIVESLLNTLKKHGPGEPVVMHTVTLIKAKLDS